MFGRNLNPFNRTEKLCQLMSGEGVKVMIGPTAVTNGTTVMIPPIPIGADDLDVRIHESAIAHEPAHITEKSFSIKAKWTGKLHHFCWNVVEDVRVENNQEQQRYFGLRVWRADFIKDFQSAACRMGTHKVLTASDMRNAVKAALVVLYLRARAKQLGVVTNVKTSPKVEEVYQRVCVGFLDEVIKAKKLSETIDLAGRIFEAVRKMLKEEAEKAAKEKAAREKAAREKAEKEQAKREKAEKERAEKAKAEQEKKAKQPDEDKDESDDEPKDSESGEPKDSEDKDGKDSDEPKDSEDKNEPEDSESDEPKDSEDNDGKDSDETEPKDKDDKGEEEPEDSKSDEPESKDGDTEPKDKDEDTGDSDEPEDKDEDTGDSDEPEDKDEDAGDSDEPEDKDEDAGDSDEPEDKDDGDTGDEPESSKPEEPGLTEEQQSEADDEAQKMLDEIEQDELKTVSDQTLEEVNRDANPPENKRRLDATVVEARAGDEPTCASIAESGVELLGANGVRMTRLMVANSRPRVVRNRDYGRLDIRAVTSDIMDVRKDLYAQRNPGAVSMAAVSMLLDGSGSMRASEKSDYTIKVAHGIAHYLDAARVPFEMAYFTSEMVSDGVFLPYYLRIKGWKEPWRGMAFRRAHKYDGGQSTPLASCMIEQAKGLLDRPEDKKIAVVLTDGQPNGPGETIDLCKQIVDSLRNLGVVVIGIGINVDMSYIFGKDAVCLPPSDIGSVLVGRLTEILDAHREERSATVARR